jgi:integrase
VSSGAYYARVKIRGKIIRASLRTDVFSSAKLRLLDFVRERREATEQGLAPLFSEAVELYRTRVQQDSSMKQSSKDYRELCISKIQKSWPGLWKLRLSDLTPQACREWAARLGKEIASQYFNNVIGTLRLIIDEGVKHVRQTGGPVLENSARELSRARIPAKTLTLPEPDQFRALVTLIRDGSSWGPKAAELIEFLAYSGLRLYTEAQWVTWEDVDCQRREIVVRGNPETHTKNWEVRRIPILPDMETLLTRMRTDLTAIGRQPAGKILQVTECPVSLHKACAHLGLPRLRHHDFRHLFATRCIEAGVDIPTVARWLGHKDGGALAMKTYGHLRNEHSQEMAKRVRF